MRQAHTVDQVRAAEASLLAALPDGALMQRAAVGLAAAVSDYLGGCYGRRVLLLVGSGDNGGDALFAGAVLARRGASVAALLVEPGRVHRAGLDALRRWGGRVVVDVPDAGVVDVVLDGITGIGGRGGLRARAAAVVEQLDDAPVVAVDVPSGVEVDSGELTGPHVRADLTVTFGTHKVAHLADPASRACGIVHLVDIGLELPSAAVTALQTADVAAMLPVPDPTSHKYTRGVVGVRAGSDQYPGAGLLCVAGAAGGLAGMVRYVATTDADAAARLVHQTHPEVVVGEGRVQAWVVGSGGGPAAEQALDRAMLDGVPVVVDADALTNLSGSLPVPALLTPHAGELARMLDVPREEVEAAPLRHAREAAARFGSAVLLKGRHTLVAAPDGRVRVTTGAPSWLATAGAGDVLAGLCGALAATGLSPFDAGAVGAWLHAAAAVHAGRGGPVTAGEVAAAVPHVCRLLLETPAGTR